MGFFYLGISPIISRKAKTARKQKQNQKYVRAHNTIEPMEISN